MKFHCLELGHRFGDPAAQLTALDARLASVEGGALVLLPELALTGYVSADGDFDCSPFREPIDGPLASALADRARAHRVWLAGAIVEADGERTYNTMTLHDPNGRLVGRYRKRHPWMPETWATPGNLPHPVFAVAGLRVAAAICFDVHFLLQEKIAADVLLFSSAWVEDEGDQRFTLLPQIARAHGLWIINCNWGPGIPRIRTQGRSMIIAPDGSIAPAIAVDIPTSSA